MPVYVYTARDKQGKVVTGTQDAPSEYAAVKILQSRDLVLTKIVDFSADTVAKGAKRRKRKRVKGDDLLFFIRQMATLLDAGIPLLRALEIIGSQVDSLRLSDALHRLHADVKAGSTFRDAVGRHPKIFPPLWGYLIEAGETSGNLPLVLDQLADHLDASLALKKKVVSAMVYPAVLILVSIVAMLIFLLKIIPIFSKLFKSFGAKLPPITQFVISSSEFLGDYLLYILIGLAAGIWALRRYAKTPTGRRAIDKALLRLPLLGGFFQDTALARIAINLSTLIKSGVNLLRSIEITAQVAGNTQYETALANTGHDVQQGKSLSGALSQSPLFPGMMVDMIMIGEESGRLPDMMSRVAKYYQDRVDVFVSRLGTLVEPVILIFVGAFVGFLVVAIFLPIFSLSTVIK